MMQKKVEVGDTMEVSVPKFVKNMFAMPTRLHFVCVNRIRLRYYLLRWFSLFASAALRCAAAYRCVVRRCADSLDV